MYRSDVRHLHPEDKNKQLFIQLGESNYSNEPRYQGYKRGNGIFFREFISTPQLQTVAVFSGVIGSVALFLLGLYILAFRGKNA